MYRLHTLRLVNGKYVNYCYVGVDRAAKAAFIVDPAWSTDEIMDILEEEGVQAAAILLTHSHFDHMNKAEELAAMTGGRICISRREYEYYQVGVQEPLLLEDGSAVSVGGLRVRAYLTPGHTKGSMCYRVGNSLFTGDTLFIEGCGECSSDGGDAAEMFQSIQYLKKIIRKEDIIYPGHAFFAPVGQSAERMSDNIYMCLEDKKTFIEMRTRSNQPEYSFR